MGLFGKKPKRTLQDEAMASLKANTIELPVAALENESYSTGGSYVGDPRKDQQETLAGFLKFKGATEEYPETAWEGVVMLEPTGDGRVLVVADMFAIDQLTKKGAESYLAVTEEAPPVWCEIQIMGKGLYRRYHTTLSAQNPRP